MTQKGEKDEADGEEKPEDVAATEDNKGVYAEVANLLLSGRLVAEEPLKSLVTYCGSLLDTEKWLRDRLDRASADKPVRKQWFAGVQGIGPVLSSGLIATLSPIQRWKSVSAVWSYFMLSAVHWEAECTQGHRIMSSRPLTECPVRARGQKGGAVKTCGAPVTGSQLVSAPIRRKKGWYIMGNHRAHTLAWKIATSFEKQQAEKSRYRRLYDIRKVMYQQKTRGEAKGAAGHARNMALRYVAKRFLEDTVNAWRMIEGLPPFTPYPVAVLGHPQDYEEPRTDKFRFKPVVSPPSVLDPEFRYLVDSYYDVQALRVEAFGRVVAYVKAHYAENPEWAKAVEAVRAQRAARKVARAKAPESAEVAEEALAEEAGGEDGETL